MRSPLLLFALLAPLDPSAAEYRVSSPDGPLAIVLSPPAWFAVSCGTHVKLAALFP